MLLVGASSWFAGNALPSSIPDISALIGIYGQAEIWAIGSNVGDAELEFTTLSVTSGTPQVPSLGPIGLTVLCGFLLGLPLVRRFGVSLRRASPAL